MSQHEVLENHIPTEATEAYFLSKTQHKAPYYPLRFLWKSCAAILKIVESNLIPVRKCEPLWLPLMALTGIVRFIHVFDLTIDPDFDHSMLDLFGICH